MSSNIIEPQFSTRVAAGYQLRLSSEAEDPAWDRFLANTPGGHHVQTSLWARVKGLLGWRAVRLIISQGEQIVAGMQLLLRPLPLVGSIAYVSRGPVFGLDDPQLYQLVLDQLHRIAKIHRVQYLIVQPPSQSENFAHHLPAWGFQKSSVQVAPTATILIDLSQDLERILAQMRKTTRKNVRRALADGLTVRQGTEQDLPAFYRLAVATSQRRNFSPFPEEYFYNLWRILNPQGHIKLFIVEHQGEPVVSELVIAFGDTVVFKISGWSGEYRQLYPNELIHWAVIEWAKSQGYRYCDLEGIDIEAARVVQAGEALPEEMSRTPTFFKLGLGGTLTFFPSAYDHVYNPILRWGYYALFRKIKDSPQLKNFTNKFRTR